MTRDVIQTLGLVLGAGLLARVVAEYVRLPEVLLLVAAGALAGPSVLDVVDIPLDSLGAQLVFTLGVSAILFHGGLNLSVDVLRRVWLSLGLLALPGVLLTTAIVAAVARVLFDLPWDQALLMGAVLSPTDPAILIPLFVGSRLRPKVGQTVVAESALNDPVGAVLALTLAAVVLGEGGGIGEPVADFAGELAISAVLGIVAGVLLALTISSRRAGIWRDSAPLAVLAVVAVSYVSLDSAGGSGYLGAFLAGLVVGNMERLGLAMHSEHEHEMHVVAGTLSDVVTVFVFITVGANLPFGHHGRPGAARAGADRRARARRPAAHRARLRAPDRGARWTRPELVFLAWTRETGRRPARRSSACSPALGVPGVDVLASVVAIAILVTLIAQAMPAPWLARRLGLLEEPEVARP